MPPQKNAGNRSAKKESGISAKNRRFKQDFLHDLRAEGGVENVYIARVLRKMGDGRMEVFYVKPVGKSGETRGVVDQAVIRGSFRGRGKRSVWIDIGTFTAVAETGLGGSIGLEIIGVFSPDEMREISQEFDVDARVLAVDSNDGAQLLASKMTTNTETGYDFDAIKEEDLEIDDI
jgi:hypothetical protein